MSSSYQNLETGARTSRHILPSAIRRGRMRTSPVWQTELASGEVWQFNTRRDALNFAAAGGCKHGAEKHCWSGCNGYRIAASPGGPDAK